ncbi:hypothetical protein CEXT_346691 [Caerostris extrusa]|uniref:Transmembrane protein n=1 Tax=Caerostris extrusa TaxID=172846 RepID=A0AAV4P3V9_CAEEX|nr:hypothetical protein CEXT_346691 [Caerostris extrusa]
MRGSRQIQPVFSESRFGDTWATVFLCLGLLFTTFSYSSVFTLPLPGLGPRIFFLHLLEHKVKRYFFVVAVVVVFPLIFFPISSLPLPYIFRDTSASVEDKSRFAIRVLFHRPEKFSEAAALEERGASCADENAWPERGGSSGDKWWLQDAASSRIYLDIGPD